MAEQSVSALRTRAILDTQESHCARSTARGGKAHALVRRRDLAADTTVTDLHNDTTAQGKQDRSAPLFLRLFPDSLSVVVRMALESELPVLRILAHKLAEEETPAALKKAHTTAPAAAIERGDDAIRGREEAFAGAGRVTAKRAWREISSGPGGMEIVEEGRALTLCPRMKELSSQSLTGIRRPASSLVSGGSAPSRRRK